MTKVTSPKNLNYINQLVDYYHDYDCNDYFDFLDEYIKKLIYK